jgi:hypothetical protein
MYVHSNHPSYLLNICRVINTDQLFDVFSSFVALYDVNGHGSVDTAGTTQPIVDVHVATWDVLAGAFKRFYAGPVLGGVGNDPTVADTRSE